MLQDELLRLKNSDAYPLHMPGHKRSGTNTGDGEAEGPSPLDEARKIDITEIEGYDNLYDARGILKDAMDYAGQVYGCPYTFYLVNGSTVGILTAIHAVAAMYKDTSRGLLIASNCHRSVSAGAELAGLKTDIIDPEPVISIPGAVSATALEERLRTARAEGYDYAATVITSPTYEGIISDITAIAKVCHKYDTVLIVDEAHGAHLDLYDGFPEGALRGGADMVIHSTHKTLASMTQTALLHVQGGLVDITLITKYLTMLQTSSPSYVLMASIDDALHHITEHPDLVDIYLKRYRDLVGSLMAASTTDRDGCVTMKQSGTYDGLRNLKILTDGDLKGHGEIRALDPCKLVIFSLNKDMNGYGLMRILHDDYHIDMEMATDRYVLGILTYMDGEEGFERLTRALREIDDRLGVGYYNMNGESAESPYKDVPEEKRALYAPCIPRNCGGSA